MWSGDSSGRVTPRAGGLAGPVGRRNRFLDDTDGVVSAHPSRLEWSGPSDAVGFDLGEAGLAVCESKLELRVAGADLR